jgi:hypothetical protein
LFSVNIYGDIPVFRSDYLEGIPPYFKSMFESGLTRLVASLFRNHGPYDAGTMPATSAYEGCFLASQILDWPSTCLAIAADNFDIVSNATGAIR